MPGTGLGSSYILSTLHQLIKATTVYNHANILR